MNEQAKTAHTIAMMRQGKKTVLILIVAALLLIAAIVILALLFARTGEPGGGASFVYAEAAYV